MEVAPYSAVQALFSGFPVALFYLAVLQAWAVLCLVRVAVRWSQLLSATSCSAGVPLAVLDCALIWAHLLRYLPLASSPASLAIAEVRSITLLLLVAPSPSLRVCSAVILHGGEILEEEELLKTIASILINQLIRFLSLLEIARQMEWEMTSLSRIFLSMKTRLSIASL